MLAQRASDLDWTRFEGIRSLGITAGASAPEVIVEEIMGAFAERYELHVETVSAAEENEFFPLPRSLRPDAAVRTAMAVYTDVAAEELAEFLRLRHRRTAVLQGHRRRRREFQLPAAHQQGRLHPHAV